MDNQCPTVWERLKSSPLLFLSRLLYIPPRQIQSQHNPRKIRVICISDTHNTHHAQPPLPDGDILIHAGDLTINGTQQEHDDVLSWFESQPHPHKFFIAGNHDSFLATTLDPHQYISTKYPSITYLQETSAEVTIRGRTLRIYGSPYTPQHGAWVFQYPEVHTPSYSPSTSEYQCTQIWSRIPPLTDILITHGPPLGHLDNNFSLKLEKSARGCYALLTTLWGIRPKLHVCGHIHVGRGVELLRWDAAQKAYEEVLAGRVGWTGLARSLWCRVLWWFRGGSGNEGGTTVVVNAASVRLGGVGDDRKTGAIAIEV